MRDTTKWLSVILFLIILLTAATPLAAAADAPTQKTVPAGNTFFVCSNNVDFRCLTRGYIDKYGDLYIWGDNDFGEVGNGSIKYQETPYLVMSNVISAKGDSMASAAITENGDLYVWGRSEYIGNGMVGDMNAVVGDKNRLTTTPTKVLSNVKDFGFFQCDCFAITKSNDLYAWGYNGWGQVGNGSSEQVLYPTKILSNVKKLRVNALSVYAETGSGEYDWGVYKFGVFGQEFPDDVDTYTVKQGDGRKTDVILSPVLRNKLNIPDDVMLPLDHWFTLSLIFDYPDHNDGHCVYRQEADIEVNSYGFEFKKDGTLVYQDIEIKNVYCYDPGVHCAYILTTDGEIYLFTKEDKSLVKLAEGAALPYSTITLDSYLSSINSKAWYYENIKYVYTKGLCEGIPMSDFVPDHNLTRAMLVQMLYNLEGQPKTSSQNQYDDVHVGDWYEKATVWATGNGIINGYGNGKFGPNDPILREQVVAIIYRYADYKGLNTSKRNNLSAFTDKNLLSSYATDAMQWAVAEGIINGMTPTTIGPKGYNTCAQISAIVMRFCKNLN